MADLHPEVLALIEAGHLHKNITLPDGSRTGWRETEQEFARRCVLRAVELEREECAKVCENVYGDEVGAVGNNEPMMVGAKCAAAIRRRGKL